MEVFFNELSVRPAASNAEARQWIETLAKLGQSLQQIVESVSENQFAFRRSEEFGLLQITPTQTVFEFLQEQYDFADGEYAFLLGVFDSPYITENDPQRSDFEYTSLTIGGTEHGLTGLAAAYLKTSLAVSFDSDAAWDTCRLDVQINRIVGAKELSSIETVEHASRQQHILDCHLVRLASLFDWSTHRPAFNATAETQTLLPLISIYSLLIDESGTKGWTKFYQEIARLTTGERVAKINDLAARIAAIHQWQPATGSLKLQNTSRTIYIIPRSNLMVTVDTQHGEFEVHSNQTGNNHLGSISFDGKQFKYAVKNRGLRL